MYRAVIFQGFFSGNYILFYNIQKFCIATGVVWGGGIGGKCQKVKVN